MRWTYAGLYIRNQVVVIVTSKAFVRNVGGLVLGCIESYYGIRNRYCTCILILWHVFSIYNVHTLFAMLQTQLFRQKSDHRFDIILTICYYCCQRMFMTPKNLYSLSDVRQSFDNCLHKVDSHFLSKSDRVLPVFSCDEQLKNYYTYSERLAQLWIANRSSTTVQAAVRDSRRSRRCGTASPED